MTMAERIQRVKVNARHTTVIVSQNKPAQIRTPWSVQEEEARIDLIQEYGDDGVKYAKLKAIDEERDGEAQLGRRSAEDMRFKARNQKVQWLR